MQRPAGLARPEWGYFHQGECGTGRAMWNYGSRVSLRRHPAVRVPAPVPPQQIAYPQLSTVIGTTCVNRGCQVSLRDASLVVVDHTPNIDQDHVRLVPCDDARVVVPRAELSGGV